MLGVTTDPQADTVYIQFSDSPVSYTKELDENRFVDYASDDTAVGVEFLAVSEGVDADDIPQSEQVSQIIAGLGLKEFA